MSKIFFKNDVKLILTKTYLVFFEFPLHYILDVYLDKYIYCCSTCSMCSGVIVVVIVW